MRSSFLGVKKMKLKSVKNLRKAKKVKLAGHGRGPEGPTGRFWTQWIEPKGAALLAQTLMPCHFVVKNHGPESLRLVAQNGDLTDLPSGKVRATYAHRTVTVENRSEKWVLIEFDFVPVHVMR
jgi:hypothetical protein